MKEVFQQISQSYSGYYNYLIKEILNPAWENYFYALIFFSAIVWLLEIIIPWRKNQKVIRKDFFLDLFYMFFNFFIFNLILFVAVSDLSVLFFKNVLAFANLQIEDLRIINISEYPIWLGLLIFFILTDFIQWCVHVSLHRFPFLWNFHKIHHSVKEMGFAAHLRYHWIENVFYKSVIYLLVALIGGFHLQQVFIVHYFALLIGHLNHANFSYNLGPLKYVFNSSQMHIWHHSKSLPEEHSFGMNFGISLSIWDYIFKTNYQPYDGRDIELGYHGESELPDGFIKQELFPFCKFENEK
jgi:sterol desaturase/sphingolipid hydroxylase (fatty acid hydroxylase superfamily)